MVPLSHHHCRRSTHVLVLLPSSRVAAAAAAARVRVQCRLSLSLYSTSLYICIYYVFIVIYSKSHWVWSRCASKKGEKKAFFIDFFLFGVFDV
jgi:hypothetical protein